MINFSLKFRCIVVSILMSFLVCISFVHAQESNSIKDILIGEKRINEDLKFSQMIIFEQIIFKTDEIIGSFDKLFVMKKYEIFEDNVINLQRINNKVVEVYYKKNYQNLNSLMALKKELKLIEEKINKLLDRYIHEEDNAFNEEERIIIKNSARLLLNIDKDIEYLNMMLGGAKTEMDIKNDEIKENKETKKN